MLGTRTFCFFAHSSGNQHTLLGPGNLWKLTVNHCETPATMSFISEFLQQTVYMGKRDDSAFPKQGGTVTPDPHFSAVGDTGILDKAIKAKGVDENTIIDVLAKRSNAQRQQIKASYEKSSGKPLDAALKSALKGELEDVVLALLRTPAQYDAQQLRLAMKGLGTDEDTLIEILASRTNKEIREIKVAYKEEYKKELEDEIKSDTSGDFRTALLSLCKANRSEDTTVNLELADSDARTLYEAGEKRKGTDCSVFIDILTTRSAPQLRQTFESFNVPLPLTKVLTRVMVSRSEVDLAWIKQEYKNKFGKTLYQDILDDTQGDYEKILLALCGSEN
uniref:Annexin n=1 Tax=Esox lucius TaxID=8010 RepID=A0AAY5KE46_ESOLU